MRSLPEITEVPADDYTAVAPRLTDLVTDCDRHDGVATLNEQTMLRLTHHGLADARLWLAADDGFALLHGNEFDLAVRPGARGQGIGTALAHTVVAEAHPDRVEAWSHADHPAAVRLAAAYQVPRVRDLHIMARPTSLPLPDRTVPDGVVIRTFRPSDVAAILHVNAAAFADHPEQGGMTESDFNDRVAQEWFDAAGLFLAVREDATDPLPPADLLGFHWTKEHRDAPEPVGEVYVVAVAPHAHGHGHGTLLTLVGLRHLADRGLPEVILYVDGDNTAAITVYERLGFTVRRTEAQYVGRPLPRA